MLAQPYSSAYQVGGNYAPGIHPQSEASRRGYNQNLWLFGQEHLVTEVGTMNFFVLWKNDQGGVCSRHGVFNYKGYGCCYIFASIFFALDGSSILTLHVCRVLFAVSDTCSFAAYMSER